MGTKQHFLLLIFTTLVLAGCYDDDKVWDALDDQQLRIEALESWQKATTSNIEALRVLSGEKECITGVNPIIFGGKTVGYTIIFSSHDPVSIYHGTTGSQGSQGADGEAGVAGTTPDIGITRGEDGNWYWTLNGQLLTDTDGNPMRANPQDGQDGSDGKPGTDGQPGTPGQDGNDGQPGADAPAPQVKTGSQLIAAGVPPIEGNPPAWNPQAIYLSVDGGIIWTQVSGSDGADGKPIFESVDNESNPDYIIFTLSDGTTTLRLPRDKAPSLSLNFTYRPSNEQTAKDISIDLNEAILPFPAQKTGYYIHYTVSATGIEEKNIRISAYVDKNTNWDAKVNREEKSILITPSGTAGSRSSLHVTATDNNGHSCKYQFVLKHYFDGYDGSDESKAFTISCVQELDNLSKMVNAGDDNSGKYFRMDNDINLRGIDWTPIGKKTENTTGLLISYPFEGNFDGGGYCIRGLKVNMNGEPAGLFAKVEGGKIENLTLISPEIKTTVEQCGALIGYCVDGTIKNCYVKDGNCTANKVVGGLIGEVRNTTLNNCHVKGTKITANGKNASDSKVGGLVGYIGVVDKQVFIKYCSASNCSLTASQGECGGLIGTFRVINSLELEFMFCYTTGTITSNGKVGALIGNAVRTKGEKINIKGCYAKCTLNNESDASLKFIGYLNNELDFTYETCFLITGSAPDTLPSGITYQAELDKTVMDALNLLAKKMSVTTPFHDDGSLKAEEWKQ